MERLIAVPGGISVRGLGGDRRGEMQVTRFLRNVRVTVAEMAQTAATRTAEPVRGRHILAIQDTTSLRDDSKRNSLNLHARIAVDAENRALLGLLGATILERDARTRTPRASARTRKSKAGAGWMVRTTRPG